MFRVRYIIIFFSTLAFFSCDRNGVYEANINTPNESWNMNNTITFNVPVVDTITFQNIIVNIRNTTDYPNANLYLFVTTTSPQGATICDTIEGVLADDQGKWLGKGFGYIHDNRILYKHNIRFPQKGDYKIAIKQAMRTDELKGISSVGVRIEKSILGSKK
mgnify:CR=1 FL=1